MSTLAQKLLHHHHHRSNKTLHHNLLSSEDPSHHMVNVAPAIENKNNKSNHLQAGTPQQSHTDRQTFKLKKRGIITGANLPLLIRLPVSSLRTTATHNSSIPQ
jgi:hypothetical protein